MLETLSSRCLGIYYTKPGELSGPTLGNRRDSDVGIELYSPLIADTRQTNHVGELRLEGESIVVVLFFSGRENFSDNFCFSLLGEISSFLLLAFGYLIKM
jgi:hypothetical protein